MSAIGRPRLSALEHEPGTKARRLDELEKQIRSCRKCRDEPDGAGLDHEPRPILQVSTTARIAVFGQAPGIRAHVAGKPFKDPSGQRLRSWMGIEEAEFYDASRVVIAPIGFCFPGYDAKGSDLPPRRECAPMWRNELLSLMPQIELALVIGGYAHKWHLGAGMGATLHERVGNWEAILAAAPALHAVLPNAAFFPLPHPSWRNNAWLRANPWFDEQLVPELRRRVGLCLRARRQ